MLDVNGKVAGAEVLLTVYGSSSTMPFSSRRRVTTAGMASCETPAAAPGWAAWRPRRSGVSERREVPAHLRVHPGQPHRRHDRRARGRAVDAAESDRRGPDVERHGKYRFGIEGIWYGEQPLDDNPYRSRSKPYLYIMAIAAPVRPARSRCQFRESAERATDRHRSTRGGPRQRPEAGGPPTCGRHSRDSWRTWRCGIDGDRFAPHDPSTAPVRDVHAADPTPRPAACPEDRHCREGPLVRISRHDDRCRRI